MRARLSNDGNDNFSQKLLKLGSGKLPSPIAHSLQVLLDNELAQTVHSLEILIETIYPDIEHLTERNFDWLYSRAIVSPKNSSVNEINKMIIEKVPGDFKCYKSIDNVCNIEDTVHYLQEFLNSLYPAGLPPHELKLKVGTPIMLLRNLSPPNMCNGTRLLIKELRDNLIIATIITGPTAGQLAHIPRIPMIPTDLPMSFKRLQFPVKVSFALIINKSQGQTFSIFGIDLREECFSHSQLYVALSRVGFLKINIFCCHLRIPQPI